MHVNGSVDATQISAGQCEALRKICRRMAAIGGTEPPAKLESLEDVVAGLTSLTEVCARRLKNRHDNTELRLMREEAEDLERLKTRFIRNVSHELRTPLASIDGFARA